VPGALKTGVQLGTAFTQWWHGAIDVFFSFADVAVDIKAKRTAA